MFGFGICMLTFAHSVSAATNPAVISGKPGSFRGGVTISPAFQQVTLDPGQAAKTFDFKITNNTNEPYEFALSVVDFGSLDDTGGVLFVGNAQKSLNVRYALSPWVTLEKDRVVVEPKSTENVPVSIDNRESLSPGGHYGAVLVSPTEATAKGDRKVQIDQVLTSLLFVKKVGGEIYGLKLRDFDVNTQVFGLPDMLDLRFQNSGNVHLIPRGLVTLSDPTGRIVKRGIINADSGIVLPESFRQVRTPLDNLGSSLMPGRYKLTVVYRYDDRTETQTIVKTFYYINAVQIVLLMAVIGIVIYLCANKAMRNKLQNVTKTISAKLPKIEHRIHR